MFCTAEMKTRRFEATEPASFLKSRLYRGLILLPLLLNVLLDLGSPGALQPLKTSFHDEGAMTALMSEPEQRVPSLVSVQRWTFPVAKRDVIKKK